MLSKLPTIGTFRYNARLMDPKKLPIYELREELAEALSPLMHYCIEQFGPDRCMFESNFPVDKVSYSYNVVYNAFKRLSTGYSAAERAAMVAAMPPAVRDFVTRLGYNLGSI